MSAMCRLIRKPENTLRTPDSQTGPMTRRAPSAPAVITAARRRVLAGAGAWLLLAVAGLLAGCISGGGQHNGTGVNNQLINLNGDVTVDNQPAGPNLNFTDGSTATLHFTISNVGDKPSDQLITITATLPAGLTYVSYASITSGNWTCSASGQTITCTSSVSVAGLAMGVAIYNVTVKVTATGSGNAQLPVTISTPDGTPSSNSGAKGVIYAVAPPVIASVTPASATGGTQVTIAGSNFGSSPGKVTFSSKQAILASASDWTDTTIKVTVAPGTPEGAGTAIVTTASGVSSDPNNSSAKLTVTGPQVTGLSPTSGPISTKVTIAGSGFGASQGTSTVSFNGTAAITIDSWSDTSIVAEVPSLATSGNVVVAVAGIGSPTNSSTMFTVTGAGGCASGGNAASLLTGDYAFGGQGWAGGTTFSTVIGRFHADGVNTISNGLIQKNSIGSGATSGNPTAFSGCFVLNTPAGATGVALGTLTLNTSPAMTLSIAIRTNGNGNFITDDAISPQLSGVLEKQCPNATNGACPAFASSNFSGNYGLAFYGIAPGSPAWNYGVAGQLTANGSNGSSGVVDISSYAGVIALNDQLRVSGGVTDTANGRAELDLNLTYNSGPGNGQAVTLIMDCYLANLSSSGIAGSLYCMSAYYASLSPNIMPLLSGRFVAQSTPAGGWTNANVAPASNASVTWSTGVDGAGDARINIGQFTYNTSASPATLSITQDLNKGGSWAFQQGTETISVASNGRVEASLNGTLVGVCYMLAAGQGFCVDEANNAALGTFVPQEAEPTGGFTSASFANSFALATLDPATGGVLDIGGVLTATGASGTLSGPENVNSTAGLSAPSFAATYSIMSAADAPVGRFTVMETAPATDTLILYVIDANTAVAVSTTSTQPAVLYMKH
jgi:hypothetical protein